MPEMKHGRFGWVELMTTQAEAAKTFYTGLFGWETEEYPMQDKSYTIVKAGGEPIGGIMPTPKEAEGAPPMWGVYVTVENVDLTSKTAKELGGRVLVEPTDIPGVGRFCVIQDPQGAVISAITYST